jgi:predicted nucleotidyltransferase
MEVARHIAASLAGFFSGRAEPGIAAVYLFGSHATGRAHRESDVDVAVLLDWKHYPGRRERFDERVRLSSELISAVGTNEIDVVILNDAPPALGAKIVTTGRRVFCSNAKLDRGFFRDVQLRAADLIPFLRRTRRVKLAAILR